MSGGGVAIILMERLLKTKIAENMIVLNRERNRFAECLLISFQLICRKRHNRARGGKKLEK